MNPTPSAIQHPSPHRDKAKPVLQAVALAAGPTSWITQLLLSYGLSAWACQPRGQPRFGTSPSWSGEWITMLAVNLLCVAGVVAGVLCGLRVWRTTGSEKPGSHQTLLEIGEGRTRFLAACGIMASGGFGLAILFNTYELFTIPACWRGAP